MSAMSRLLRRDTGLPALANGGAAIQCNLGITYETGDGTLKDLALARHWYTKAAEQGHAKSQFNLGVLLDSDWEKVDASLAAHWYNQAAGQGHPAPQSQCSTCMTEQDLKLALVAQTMIQVTLSGLTKQPAHEQTGSNTETLANKYLT